MKDIIFLNEPILYEIEDYKQSLGNIATSLKIHPEIFSVHQIGEISCPGISDIDLLVVVDKDFKGDLRYLDVRKLSSKHRYLFPHQMYVIPSSLVDDFKFLFPIFSINTLYGPQIQRGDSVRELDLILLTDMSVLRWPWEFLAPLAQKRIENRRLLGRLISLRHSLRLYQQVCGQTHEGLEWLVQESLNLAKDWSSIDEKERQKELIEKIYQAYLIIDDLLERFSIFLKDRGITFNGASGHTLFVDTNHLVFFGNNIDAKKRTSIPLEIWHNRSIFVSFLPRNFSFSLMLYQESNSSLGRYIRNNIKYDKKIMFEVPKEIKDALLKRLELLNLQIEFLSNNRLAYGYFMNFDYIYPFNLKFALRNRLKTLNSIWLHRRFFNYLSKIN